MTTQYEVIDGLATGLSLSAKIFDMDAPDTEVTVDDIDINEGATAKGRYVIEITNATALSGEYTTRLFVGSVPIAVMDRRFAGTDGETAEPLPIAAVLDSAVGTQITNIENAAGYLLAIGSGAISNAQTATETYVISVFGSQFQVAMAGLTSTGTRTAPTLTKS